MLKSIVKFFSGGDEDSGPSGSGPSGLRDLENFVDYIVRALVDAPEKVRVFSEEDKELTVIKINCQKEDIGKIVGKRGKTIMAIRALVSGAANRMQKKVSVEVID